MHASHVHCLWPLRSTGIPHHPTRPIRYLVMRRRVEISVYFGLQYLRQRRSIICKRLASRWFSASENKSAWPSYPTQQKEHYFPSYHWMIQMIMQSEFTHVSDCICNYFRHLHQVVQSPKKNPAKYSGVQYSTVQCSTAQYSTVQYSTVQYSAVQYSIVQYSIVQYSTVQYSAV